MKTFVRETQQLPGHARGWGNGYVIIPAGHPAHGKHYDEINVEAHGGLTFSEKADDIIGDWDQVTEEDKGGWVVGFDTGHCYDDRHNCRKSYVLRETENLKKELIKLKEES